jgi:glyoxylase-like metal-dependent hydrolase (beta-lactamase superfamily II)
VELFDGLHRIDTPLGPRTSSLYLIVGSRTSLLFDTGVAGTVDQYVLPYLAANGLTPESIAWVVISHCDVDHSGGTGDVHQYLPRARVVAHAADADAIADYATYERVRARGFRQPYGWDEDEDVLAWARSVTRTGPVDLRLQAEAVIDLGDRTVDVLHVPGHTAGHLALVDSASRAAVVSDAVLGAAVRNTDGTAAFPPTYRYVPDYLNTIERLRALAPQQLLTAHYPSFDGDEAIRFLDESAGFVAKLDAEVRRVLEHGSFTLAQLVGEIDPAIGDWPREGTAGALVFPVAGHLEDLLARGLVARSDDDSGAAVFRSTGAGPERRT